MVLLKNLNTPEGKLAYEQERLAKHISTSQRSKPMRVLVLGSARTGTTSMLTALGNLGYRTYHMQELFKHPKQFRFWVNAIQSNFGDNPTYCAPDFEAVVSDFDAVSDVPIVIFTPELLAAYPDAKVILTTRDPQKWVESMRSTIWQAQSWWTWDWLALFNPGMIAGFRACDTLVWDAFINSTPEFRRATPARRDYLSDDYRELAVRKFIEHNEYVKSLVPKENLLEFEPSMGYEPLCKFLGRAVPEGGYPRANKKDDHIKVTTMLWYFGFMVAILKIIMVILLLAGCVWSGQRYFS